MDKVIELVANHRMDGPNRSGPLNGKGSRTRGCQICHPEVVYGRTIRPLQCICDGSIEHVTVLLDSHTLEVHLNDLLVSTVKACRSPAIGVAWLCIRYRHNNY